VAQLGHKQNWVLDVYANAYFYNDNTSYHGVEILRQQALPGLEGHISYSCTPNLWVSLDTRYSFRGDAIVNGTDQNDAQQNFTLGSEVNVSTNPRNLLVFKLGQGLQVATGQFSELSGCRQSKSNQGSVPSNSTLANDFSL
jgi:hypothetical protein